ncbi:MAG TPA: glycerophosphodiester phosphodiesterase [Stellaceae bacterium]|nr:glycerophosphodiester phosphodiesterase [Stellaceae bacterium]
MTRASRLPRVIGHRGAAAHAPENTLAGFRVAKLLGAAWVEFDVRLTADGRCILLHDDTIERTTDGRGVAAELTLAELAVFDAGAWFDPKFAGETVPTLEEAIDLLAELGLGANIEIKPHPGAGPATARAVVDILRTNWPASLPAPLLSSFDRTALEAARDAAPGIERGVLLRELGTDWRSLADALDATTVHCDHSRLTAAKAKEVQASGYPLLAYTVNHAGRAEELAGWGVCGFFTDVPDQLAGLARSGPAMVE